MLFSIFIRQVVNFTIFLLSLCKQSAVSLSTSLGQIKDKKTTLKIKRISTIIKINVETLSSFPSVFCWHPHCLSSLASLSLHFSLSSFLPSSPFSFTQLPLTAEILKSRRWDAHLRDVAPSPRFLPYCTRPQGSVSTDVPTRRCGARRAWEEEEEARVEGKRGRGIGEKEEMREGSGKMRNGKGGE